jgi:hypothetical protein
MPQFKGVILLISSLGLLIDSTAPTTLPDDSANQIQQITDLANKLVDGLNRGDQKKIDAVVDWGEMFTVATEGIVGEDKFRKALISDEQAGWSAKQMVLSDLVEGKRYDLLRVREENGELVAIIRIRNILSNFDYQKWFAKSDSQGDLKFLDYYSLSQGVRRTQLFRRRFVIAAALSHPNVVLSLQPKDEIIVNWLPPISAMYRDLRSRNSADWLKQYQLLSPLVQRDMIMMEARITVARSTHGPNSQECVEALADFRKYHPGDPASEYQSFDEFRDNRQYHRLLDCISVLEDFTGGDPLLLTYQGRALQDEGGDENLFRARKLYEEAIKEDPYFYIPYWALLRWLVAEHNYYSAVALLPKLSHAMGDVPLHLERMSFYSDFINSDAYLRWKQSQIRPATQSSN